MSCVDCEFGPKRHDEIVDDLSIVNSVVDAINHGHLYIAIQEIEILQRRLEQRHLVATGRKI